MSTQPETFRTAIRNVQQDYKSIIAKVIAFEWKNVWLNVATRLVLSPEIQSGGAILPTFPEIPELLLAETTFEIKDLDRLIDIYKTGELTLQGKTVQYKSWRNSKWEEGYFPSFISSRMYGIYRSGFAGFDCLVFALRGTEFYLPSLAGEEGRRNLEARLSSADPPFAGIADLATQFLGPLEGMDPWSYCILEHIAPIEAKFVGGCELRNNELFYKYRLRSRLSTSETSVGYVTYVGEKAVARGRASTPNFKEMRSSALFEGNIALPPDFESAVTFLSYRGEEVDRNVFYRGIVSGRNPRILAQEIVDPGLERFSRGLLGTAGNSAEKGRRGKDRTENDFERAVLLLFHFLGFSCNSVVETSDSVDILAFTDKPDEVLLVECTIGSIGVHNKLGKLSSRRKLYSGKIKQPLAVIVTSLARDEISPLDLEQAQKERIIIQAAADLTKLVALANQGETTGTVFAHLQGISNAM